MEEAFLACILIPIFCESWYSIPKFVNAPLPSWTASLRMRACTSRLTWRLCATWTPTRQLFRVASNGTRRVTHQTSPSRQRARAARDYVEENMLSRNCNIGDVFPVQREPQSSTMKIYFIQFGPLARCTIHVPKPGTQTWNFPHCYK